MPAPGPKSGEEPKTWSSDQGQGQRQRGQPARVGEGDRARRMVVAGGDGGGRESGDEREQQPAEGLHAAGREDEVDEAQDGEDEADRAQQHAQRRVARDPEAEAERRQRAAGPGQGAARVQAAGAEQQRQPRERGHGQREGHGQQGALVGPRRVALARRAQRQRAHEGQGGGRVDEVDALPPRVVEAHLEQRDEGGQRHRAGRDDVTPVRQRTQHGRAGRLVQSRHDAPMTARHCSTLDSGNLKEALAMSLVLTEDRGPVRHVVLNRPEKRNALNDELILAHPRGRRRGRRRPRRALRRRARRGPDVLVRHGLRRPGGAGRRPRAPARVPPPDPRGVEPARGDAEADDRQIHGACIGGAMELALACDLRVMAADAIIGMPETRVGLIPDVGGSSRLPAVVGLGRAKELIMTGKLIDGTEAERIGLVNRVAPADELDAATDALVGELLACAPVAVGLAKRVIDAAAKPALARRSSTRSPRRSCARAPRTSPRARGPSPRSASRSSAGAERVTRGAPRAASPRTCARRSRRAALSASSSASRSLLRRRSSAARSGASRSYMSRMASIMPLEVVIGRRDARIKRGVQRYAASGSSGSTGSPAALQA